MTGHPTAMGLLRRILVSIHSWIDGKIISCNKTIRPKTDVTFLIDASDLCNVLHSLKNFSFLLSVSVTAIILTEFDNITKRRNFLVEYKTDFFS